MCGTAIALVEGNLVPLCTLSGAPSLSLPWSPFRSTSPLPPPPPVLPCSRYQARHRRWRGVVAHSRRPQHSPQRTEAAVVTQVVAFFSIQPARVHSKGEYLRSSRPASRSRLLDDHSRFAVGLFPLTGTARPVPRRSASFDHGPPRASSRKASICPASAGPPRKVERFHRTLGLRLRRGACRRPRDLPALARFLEQRRTPLQPPCQALAGRGSPCARSAPRALLHRELGFTTDLRTGSGRFGAVFRTSGPVPAFSTRVHILRLP